MRLEEGVRFSGSPDPNCVCGESNANGTGKLGVKYGRTLKKIIISGSVFSMYEFNQLYILWTHIHSHTHTQKKHSGKERMKERGE